MGKITIVFLMALLGLQAFAAGTSKKAKVMTYTETNLPVFTGETAPLPKLESIRMTPEKFAAEMTLAEKRASRGVASGKNFEDMMSPELQHLRNEILTLKTAGQLSEKLEALNKLYESKYDNEVNNILDHGLAHVDSKDRDFRFFAAELLPLRCLRGIVFRFVPIAEKARLVDSHLVTEVMKLAQGMQLLSPEVIDLVTEKAKKEQKQDNQENISKILFDYMTLPYDNVVLFREGADLQSHLATQCSAALQKSANRIEALDLNKEIVWDNKVAFGVGSFKDDLDRYKLIGESEKHFSLAMKNIGMHFISFFRAYTIHDYFALQHDLGMLYFKDAELTINRTFLGITGADFDKRTAVIRKASGTFIRYSDGSNYMLLAKTYLQRAVAELDLVWKEVKDKPENKLRVVNPGFLSGFNRGTEATLANWRRLTENDQAPMQSRLTERVTNVSLNKFYDNPPIDLKAFLPKSFDESRPPFESHPGITVLWMGDDKKVQPAPSTYSKHRNFYAHQAQDWDVNAWRLVFPSLKDGHDVPQELRTLNQSWGGSLVAMPLMQFVR